MLPIVCGARSFFLPRRPPIIKISSEHGLVMGIRFSCPNGHKLHVKEFLAGKRGVCPSCGAKFIIPQPSPTAAPARSGAGASSPTPARPPVDPASASIVISIVEPSRAPLARATTNPPAAPPEPVAVPPSAPESPTEIVAPPVTGPEASLIAAGPADADASASVPPATKYIAQRNRSRRNQTRLAIGLLIAVVILAIILIAVLQGRLGARGEDGTAAIGFSIPPSYAANAALPTELQTASRRIL